MPLLGQFGEKVSGYKVRVLNEREVRAGAGILFLLAFFSFMQVFLASNYYFIKIFVTAFMIDFIIRLFIHPRYSPTLIISKLIVRHQKVEYTGAPQKQFAWSLGLIMSATMFGLLVVANQASLFSCLICLICLALLFMETAFGICVGCLIYNLFNRDKAQYCPGGVCEVHQLQPIQRVNPVQLSVLILGLVFVWWFANSSLLSADRVITGQNCLLNRVTNSEQNSTTKPCLLQHFR